MNSNDDRTEKLSFSILAGVMILFIAGRLFGANLFDNNWSFTYWEHLPLWYLISWGVGVVGLLFGLSKFSEPIGKFFSEPKKIAFGLAALMILFVIFGFDSVSSSFGNKRMGQIMQADRIIFRWFELGSIMTVAALYKIVSLFVSSVNMAGLVAWKLLSYLFAAFSMVGSVLLAKELTRDNSRRLFYFLIIFFGSQSLLYFGFVGLENIVPAFCIWAALYAWQAIERNSGTALIALWGVVLLGVFMHASLALLVPAAIFVTVLRLLKSKNIVLPMALSLGAYALLLWGLNSWGAASLEFNTFFLGVDGRLPNSDYGLFSLRHIGDIIQILFLAAPLTLAVKWSNLGRIKELLESRMLWVSWLMMIGSLTFLFVSDPRESIVLALPRLLAYLAPASIFIIALIRNNSDERPKSHNYLALAATAAIMIPLSYLPSYTNIKLTEPVSDAYMENYDSYYHDACVTYRDAYFIRGEYTEADRWEQIMVVKSDEYLNLRGSTGLVNLDQRADAIRVMYRIIALNPYWPNPRARLAATQMAAGRFQLAKPQIDTALMLEPYNKDHHVHLYAYHRALRQYPQALTVINRALELFPSDPEILTDQMLIQYGVGRMLVADSLAKELHNMNDSLPFPYLVQGMIAAKRGQVRQTIKAYEKFVELAPKEPETPMIKKRIDSLKVMIGEQ